MTNKSVVGDTGTQQFGAGTSATDSGSAVQDPPAGGTSGGEEGELQELLQLMKKVRELSMEIGLLKTDKADAESKVAVAEQSVVDLSANFAKEREGSERIIQLYKVQYQCLNDKFCEVLRNICGASAAAQLHAMCVEKEQLRAAMDAAVAEVADLGVKLINAEKALVDEKAAAKLNAEGLQKNLSAAVQATKGVVQENVTLRQAVASLDEVCVAKRELEATAAELSNAKQAAEAEVANLKAELGDAKAALIDERAAAALVVEGLKNKLDAAEAAGKDAKEHVAGLKNRGFLARLRNRDVQTVDLRG